MTEQSYRYLRDFLVRCEKVTEEHDKHLLKPDLDMKIPLQILKIFEEIGEVQRALLQGDAKQAKEECCDVILTAITMMHKLDSTPDNIMVDLELTLQKCENRVKEMYS